MIFKYTRRQITIHLFDCLASNHSSQSKQAGKTKVWKSNPISRHQTLTKFKFYKARHVDA